MNFKLPLILSAATAVISSASACAPYFAPSFLVPGNAYSVTLNKKAAFKRFVQMHQDLLPAPFAFPMGTSTLRAERIDFANAVKKRLTKLSVEKQEELIDKYARTAALWRQGQRLPKNERPERMLPPELLEFELYLYGYEELLENSELADTPAAWKKLLALPAEQRHYRTAWVHFMLGNHFKKDCHTHYENCRNAVRSGFADTVGVALRSYTLEIRYGKNPVKVVRRAAEAELNKLYIDSNDYLAQIDKKWINRLSDTQYLAMLEDPLVREFLAITDLSPRFQKMISGYSLRSADIRAYHAYTKGDIKLAREYIKQLPKPTLLSVYIEAKLARQTGNTHLATKKLRQWLAMAEKATPLENELVYAHDYEKNIPQKWDVYGLLGSALVFRHNFKEAAEYFYRANSEVDLHIILERYFTLDEAMEFVEKLSDTRFDERYLYLVSRRAFRESRFDLAARYLPEQEAANLKSYIDFMTKGNDKKLDANSRAIALYNAAKILRYHGMELAGTQEAPDFFPGGYGTSLPYDDCALSKRNARCQYNKILGEWTLCREHISWHSNESTLSFPGFNAPKDHRNIPATQRYHYRYQAARLALKAGNIAKDDDLRAIIYIFGGNCLRKTSLPEADIFYKMLVNECRGSLLSKLADRQRWFPTDCVRMNKEVNHSTPLKDMAAVKALIEEIFPPAK